MNKLKDIQKINSQYRKIAFAACFGTFLEWYDFLTFATLAVVFGPLFFPSDDPNTGLLASLATFGVGMVVRPLGAAIFGSMGDRIGRKPVFMITIALMGVSTVTVGFLPTYGQIGIWAPILLVFLRLFQGLSAGGEIGGGAVYLAEHAGNKFRGLKTSFLQLMGPLGILASTIQITFLQQHLTAEEFLSWGWRVPFWISMGLLIIAFRARIALEETPVFLELSKFNKSSTNSLLDNFRDHQTRKHMYLLFFCISGGGAVLFFCVQVYSVIFLKASVGIEALFVDQLSIYTTLALMILTIFAGFLSDKIGRKPVIISGLWIGGLMTLPLFYFLKVVGDKYLIDPNNNLSLSLLGVILIALSIPLALVVGPQTAMMAEFFSAKTRNSAATFPHNVAAGWIGGLLPLIVTWLNQRWNSDSIGLWYPAIFLISAAIIGSLYLPETKEISLFLSSEKKDSQR